MCQEVCQTWFVANRGKFSLVCRLIPQNEEIGDIHKNSLVRSFTLADDLSEFDIDISKLPGKPFVYMSEIFTGGLRPFLFYIVDGKSISAENFEGAPQDYTSLLKAFKPRQ